MVTLGHYSLFFALILAGWATIASFLSFVGKGRGLQTSAERAVLGTFALIATAVVCLEHAFLTDDFRLDYVFHYSSTSQALPYKIGALWGGQAGSLLLWVLMLSAMGSIMVLTNRTKNRALMPVATSVVGLTMTFFLGLVNFLESARPFVMGAARPDGVGLNPQLKNYWMMIHPPTLYTGYVAFTIPFAFAIAALATRRTGDLWFRTTRRWTLFAWFFLGTGILLGAYWAYIELGWGGYWAWDPVENASLMPWLAGTAFLHSVMIQEKKGMLKVWNMTLIILTFSLSIFGTFLTRSGIISSVHAFATSDIGPAFGVFLGVVFFGSLVLLVTRLDVLRSEGRLESLLSRESTFLFNNMILVGIAATVLFLTTFPILSEAATGRKVTMGPPIFNLVNIPWAIVLLLLTGIGPLIAWRKASRANLKRNFTVPMLVGGWFLMLAVIVDGRAILSALGGLARAAASADVAGAFEKFGSIYPALTFGAGAFVLGTVALEFWRGVRVRRSQHGESVPVALGQLVWRNKRRYGGYVVHVGVVVVFFGIAGSSAYKQESIATLAPGGTMSIAGYDLHYDRLALEAVDDYIGAKTTLTVARDGRVLGPLVAEQRLHPNLVFPELRAAFLNAKAMAGGDPGAYHDAVAGLYPLIRDLEGRAGREVKVPSTEVGIRASMTPLRPTRFGEDLYVIPLAVDPFTGQANFRVFVNPMVNLIWLGGFVFVFGAILGLLPDARERRRLQAAIDYEERAVA